MLFQAPDIPLLQLPQALCSTLAPLTCSTTVASALLNLRCLSLACAAAAMRPGALPSALPTRSSSGRSLS